MVNLMRFVFALVVACLLAACGLGTQSGGELAFLGGGSRAAQAERDAQAILHGMEAARQHNEQVARALDRGPQSTAPAVTR